VPSVLSFVFLGGIKTFNTESTENTPREERPDFSAAKRLWFAGDGPKLGRRDAALGGGLVSGGDLQDDVFLTRFGAKD
jgi:hypothetical protein